VISSVRGPVLSALGNTVVIEVGGLGLALQVTPATALSVRLEDVVRLHSTLIVREDSLTLYGFHTVDELSVFELLVGVTGVGPKSALGVLAVLTPNQIALAVTAEDDSAFRKVSGIGPKTAKLIVLSLAGKVAVTSQAASPPLSSVNRSVADSVIAALIGLGWSEKVAISAVDDTLKDSDAADSGVAAVLRLALARLGPAQHPLSENRS
jgi:Holliday junction DNA helicase RuvA